MAIRLLDWLNALTALAGPRQHPSAMAAGTPTVAARRADERGGYRRPAFTDEQCAHLTWVDHAYALLAERDPQLTVLDVTDLDPADTHLAIHATLRQSAKRATST